MLKKVSISLALAMALAPQVAFPQVESTSDVEQLEVTPMFSVTTVARTTQAVNYRYRRSDTKVDFAGTSLSPSTQGEAEVQAKKGRVVVEALFSGMPLPNEYGAEYLTYVLWAISPQGRAVNLGEVLVDRYGRGKLNATTELQSFGMVVTAEPYYAVRNPSDLIVAENEIRVDTKGEIQPVKAKFELFPRGQYAQLSNPLMLTVDLKRHPIHLYQARNAVQIASSLKAEHYATETFGQAMAGLREAEALAKSKASKKDIATVARQAVQIAEDSRALAEKRMEQERIENARLAAAEREAKATARAEEESQLRAEAEEQRAREAELRAAAQQAKTEAESKKLKAELAAAQAQAQLERALREKEQAVRLIAEAQAEQQAAVRAKVQLEQERGRLAAVASRAQAEADRLDGLRAQAQDEAKRAARERDEMRDRMQAALSKVVDTKETGRGLILNLPDILFDFGKSTLRPGAREVISRIAGIMMVTPGYQMSIEGHTDSVGSDEFNQGLSEQRADAVFTYLDGAQVSAETMSTVGFGKTKPIASNETPDGRQQNRRVEIVIQEEQLERPSSDE